MSRHNRRRTRGGGHNKNPSMLQRSTDIDSPDLSDISSTGSGSPMSRSTVNNRSTISARHWHNRYLAWQARERRQREESSCLESEKKRLFGEDDGSSEDDEDLCEKMLEYFDGLDFIKL